MSSKAARKPKPKRSIIEWPPIKLGTRVRTTEANKRLRKEWTEEGWNSRQWGVKGTICAYHDSHGLSYEVKHPDGSIGHYDPSEIKVMRTIST